MKKLSEQVRENRAKKQARIAARKERKPDIRNPLIAVMLMQNDRVRNMILEGAQSTYVPIPRGNHKIMSNIEQYRKQQKRSENWTGLRA